MRVVEHMTGPKSQKRPEEFAAEVLGTADEQTLNWYNDQIRWREDLLKNYSMELEVLHEHRKPVAERIAAREVLRRQQPEGSLRIDDPDLPDPAIRHNKQAFAGEAETLVRFPRQGDPQATQSMQPPGEETGE